MNIDKIKEQLSKISYSPQQMEGISDSVGGMDDYSLATVAHQVFDEMMKEAFRGEKKCFCSRSSLEMALYNDKKWAIKLTVQDMENLEELFKSFEFNVESYSNDSFLISWVGATKKSWWKR